MRNNYGIGFNAIELRLHIGTVEKGLKMREYAIVA